MLLLLALLVLGGAAYLLGDAATLPARQRRLSIRRAATYGRARLPVGAELDRFRERALVPAVRSFAALALRLSPRATLDSVAAKLQGAGLGGRLSPTTFMAAKAAVGGAGLLFGVALGATSSGLGLGLLLGAASGATAFALPGALVSARARRRREEIAAQLPDALDLLAVSVEAGLGFDGAVAKLSERMEGALADEFALTLGEIRMGETRHAALKRLADRVSAPEMASFARAIVQADQLGTSLSRILRVQAADSRLRREAAAEERAMKAPIKMLFPTVLFIFPAMFLVILGPAFLNLSRLF